jgi:hypothetical protein
VPSSAISTRPAAVRVRGAVLLHGVGDVHEDRGEVFPGDRIEQIASLLGPRDLMHPKQRAGVIASVPLSQAPLIVEERRALQDKHREGAQPRVADRIAPVVAALAVMRQDLVGGSPKATPSQQNGTYRPGIPLVDQ